MRPAADSCVSRGQKRWGKRGKEIQVDKLKNVPSLAIFYWFLFWFSNAIVVAVAVVVVVAVGLKCEVFERAFVAVDGTFHSGFILFDPSNRNSFTTVFLRRDGDDDEKLQENCTKRLILRSENFLQLPFSFYSLHLSPNRMKIIKT